MPTDESIKNDIMAIVLDILKDNVKKISFEDDFYALGLNSIDRIRMVVEIEKKYGIEIDDEQDYTDEKFLNVNTTAEIVKKYLLR